MVTNNSKFTMIDLFSGTGGFSHGFVRNGKFELVYGIDIDEVAIATASMNHKNTLFECRDITKVDLGILGDQIGVGHVDVIIGGPPCQGFSSLRPNRSSKNDDGRNNLYYSFVNFVDYFQPKVFVMENVVGLITHKDGETLRDLIVQFNNIGYNVDWRVVNCANFGIPQKRERFILIGSNTAENILFPNPTHHFEGRVIGHKDRSRMIISDPSLPKAISVNQAISDLPPVTRGNEENNYQPPENEYQTERRKDNDSLTLHKATNHSDKIMEIIRHSGRNIHCIPKELISSGYSSCYSRIDGNSPGNTITVKFQSVASSRCIHPSQDRAITPREAARIQSFDDSFRFAGSLTKISNQIGNAVPPLLGSIISETVIEILEGILSAPLTQ